MSLYDAFLIIFLIVLIGCLCSAHQEVKYILPLSEKAMIMDASQSCHLHRFPHWTYTMDIYLCKNSVSGDIASSEPDTME